MYIVLSDTTNFAQMQRFILSLADSYGSTWTGAARQSSWGFLTIIGPTTAPIHPEIARWYEDDAFPNNSRAALQAWIYTTTHGDGGFQHELDTDLDMSLIEFAVYIDECLLLENDEDHDGERVFELEYVGRDALEE